MFSISLATLKRYLKRQRETGDVRAKPIPGRPAKKGAALQVRLREKASFLCLACHSSTLTEVPEPLIIMNECKFI
jgi:transposase